MRKLVLTLSLITLTACAEKLTGPEAQSAARAHRNDSALSGVLILVDGVERDRAYLGKVDADKIESIEVLKGKAAQKLYGDRAGNGVILVSMKKVK